MKDTKQPVVKRSLLSWAIAGNLKLQFLLVIIILVTVFARVLPLEMYKRVFNEAIRLKRADLLALYCAVCFAAVLTAGGLKYLTNYFQTLIGQRALAEMRKKLYHHILALPLNFFKKNQSGTVVSFLVTELNTAGEFAGSAFSVPMINVLTLLGLAGYLFWLNPLLAIVSLSIYPIVLFLIPLLQRGANRANSNRVDEARKLSDRITESVSGVHEIQSNSAFTIENRKFDSIVDRLLRIRIIWNLYRHGIKFINNFFISLGSLIILFLGGYLTIRGQLELGAMVAFLAAQEKLYDPWKELIEYYQLYQNASVRYGRTMEHFDTAVEHAVEPEGSRPLFQLKGGLEVKDLTLKADNGAILLDGITFSLRPGETMALVGASGSGKSTLAHCIGQLYKYTEGHIFIDDKEVSGLSKKDIAHNMGFVSQTPFIFNGTIEENLLYSFRARADNTGGEQGLAPSLNDMLETLQNTGLYTDVLQFGLSTVLDQDKHSALASLFIRIRKRFYRDFGASLNGTVEFFDDDKAMPTYIFSQSILDNMLFGKIKIADQKTQETITRNIIRLLTEDDLLETIVEIGMQFQVGNKGDRLSGGQRQKLAIGRTFLKAPNLLILDEATSAMDNKSQMLIQDHINSRLKGKNTLISVVHRLDIVKSYDKIAVVKNGKIAEIGQYAELVEKKGLFHDLAFVKNEI